MALALAASAGTAASRSAGSGRARHAGHLKDSATLFQSSTLGMAWSFMDTARRVRSRSMPHHAFWLPSSKVMKDIFRLLEAEPPRSGPSTYTLPVRVVPLSCWMGELQPAGPGRLGRRVSRSAGQGAGGRRPAGEGGPERPRSML